jgi:TPR repeat protein
MRLAQSVVGALFFSGLVAGKALAAKALLDPDPYPACDGADFGERSNQRSHIKMYNKALDAYKNHRYEEAFNLFERIDREYELEVEEIRASNNPKTIDLEREINIVSATRVRVAYMYRKGWFVAKDDSMAAKWYHKGFNTRFIFNNSCEIYGLPMPVLGWAQDYALMYVYGLGVPKDPQAARQFLMKLIGDAGDPIVMGIDHHSLPATYEGYLARQ